LPSSGACATFAGVLNADRLLPADPAIRRIARLLYDHVRGLPIVSPHHRLDEAEAVEVAEDLAHHLAWRAFRVGAPAPAMRA
jgi:glucuronate isomerase